MVQLVEASAVLCHASLQPIEQSVRLPVSLLAADPVRQVGELGLEDDKLREQVLTDLVDLTCVRVPRLPFTLLLPAGRAAHLSRHEVEGVQKLIRMLIAERCLWLVGLPVFAKRHVLR